MDEQLKELLADGSLEYAGVSETGDVLYTVNSKVLQKLHPDIFKRQYSAFMDGVQQLWQTGHLELKFSENDVEIQLVEKSTNPDSDLAPALQSRLKEIVRPFK